VGEQADGQTSEWFCNGQVGMLAGRQEGKRVRVGRWVCVWIDLMKRGREEPEDMCLH
jgi:hypothetical protein